MKLETGLNFLPQPLLFNSILVSFQKLPNLIVGLHAVGQRIVVMDVQESFHFVRYKARENQLVVFADDINIRSVSLVN